VSEPKKDQAPRIQEGGKKTTRLPGKHSGSEAMATTALRGKSQPLDSEQKAEPEEQQKTQLHPQRVADLARSRRMVEFFDAVSEKTARLRARAARYYSAAKDVAAWCWEDWNRFAFVAGVFVAGGGVALAVSAYRAAEILIAIGVASFVAKGIYDLWSKKHRKEIGVILCVAGMGAILGVVALIESNLPPHAVAKEPVTESAEEQNLKLQRGIDEIRFNGIDVSVTFRLDVPMDHPHLAAYRTRLERCIQKIVTTQRLACGAHNPFPTPYPSRFEQVCISPSTELYPRGNSEVVAHMILNQPGMIFNFYKSLSMESYLSGASSPDLTFAVDQNRSESQNLNQDIMLCYEITTNTLYLTAHEVLVPHHTWKSNGQITSVSDLRRASVSIVPMTSLVVFKPDEKGAGSDLIDESHVAMQISKGMRLKAIAFEFSDGTHWELPMSRLTRVDEDIAVTYVYVAP